MHEEQIGKFLEWLPSKFEEFQGKGFDEIAEMLNELYQTSEGQQTIQTLINTFNNEINEGTTQFKEGGKLDYLIQLHKKGGQLKACSCGCTLHRVFKDGGIVEKCACGCKTKVEKKQEGGLINERKPSLLDKLKKDVTFGVFNQYQEGGQIDNTRGQKVGRLAAYFGRTNYRNEPGYGDRGGRSTEYQTPNGNITQILQKNIPYGSGMLQTSRTITTNKQGIPADTTYRRPDGINITRKNNPAEFNRLTESFGNFFPHGLNNFKK